VHYRYLESQFNEVVSQCLNGMELAAILLKIDTHQRESVKSINSKIKLQILNCSPGILDGKLNCRLILSF